MFMENEAESLEGKLGKSDWKQWLPVYGAYKTIKDYLNDKPSILLDGKKDPGVFILYQTNSILMVGAGAIYGLCTLAEKIF